MIDWLLSPLGKLASIAAIVVALFLAWQADRRSQFNAGRTIERQAAIERAAELIRERAKDDAEISRMGDADLCVGLGGVWVQNECR